MNESKTTIELKNPELWESYVSKNTDAYGKATIDYADRWACAMQDEIANGKSVADVADRTSYQADTEGITGFMHNAAIATLAGCWKYGEELRRWHNSQFGQQGKSADASGAVINSCIIKIG
jgi:hypothetical protein